MNIQDSKTWLDFNAVEVFKIIQQAQVEGKTILKLDLRWEDEKRLRAIVWDGKTRILRIESSLNITKQNGFETKIINDNDDLDWKVLATICMCLRLMSKQRINLYLAVSHPEKILSHCMIELAEWVRLESSQPFGATVIPHCIELRNRYQILGPFYFFEDRSSYIESTYLFSLVLTCTHVDGIKFGFPMIPEQIEMLKPEFRLVTPIIILKNKATSGAEVVTLLKRGFCMDNIRIIDAATLP